MLAYLQGGFGVESVLYKRLNHTLCVSYFVELVLESLIIESIVNCQMIKAETLS